MSGTRRIMGQVALAALPGALVMIYFFGMGVALNLVIAAATALAAEALVLTARNRPLTPLADGSALITGLLVGLCLPPLLPLWLVVAGVLFALLFGKHLFGGLGHNPFNPAMVGYAMMIVSFPLLMSTWPAPGSSLPVADLLLYKLGLPLADGVTQATPLDAQKFRGSATLAEFAATRTDADLAWVWMNLAFLLGGTFLVVRRVCDWLMPATLLATLALLALLGYDGGSSDSLGSPLTHLLGGATMLAAFFIITDPVTSPVGRTGQILFAMGIATLTFVFRGFGAYPDGIAFAVLLMNATTPLLDQFRWRFA